MYDPIRPYSSTNIHGVAFNEDNEETLTYYNRNVSLAIGDKIYYWALLYTDDHKRVTLPNRYFTLITSKEVKSGIFSIVV